MPPSKKKGDESPADRLDRIAILSADRCKPKKCRQECKKSCPVVKIGAFPGRRGGGCSVGLCRARCVQVKARAARVRCYATSSTPEAEAVHNSPPPPPFTYFFLPNATQRLPFPHTPHEKNPPHPSPQTRPIDKSPPSIPASASHRSGSQHKPALAWYRTHAGKLCIEVGGTSKIAHISEDLCIGCGICVKKCPFEVGLGKLLVYMIPPGAVTDWLSQIGYAGRTGCPYLTLGACRSRGFQVGCMDIPAVINWCSGECKMTL